MAERVKLKVLEVRDLKPIGTKGAQLLEFRARDDKGEHLYSTFSKRLFPLIVRDAVLEADVTVESRVVGDNTYTDHKVTEIYVEGQPYRLPQALTGVQMGFQKDTASIETQVAFKGVIELMVAGIVRKDDSLGKATLGWASKRLNGTATLSSSVEQQKRIWELLLAKGIKTQEDVDRIKWDAIGRVVPLKELTAEEGDKILAFLEKKQGAE